MRGDHLRDHPSVNLFVRSTETHNPPLMKLMKLSTKTATTF